MSAHRSLSALDPNVAIHPDEELRYVAWVIEDRIDLGIVVLDLDPDLCAWLR
jgi:hypothetical protein